MQYAMVAVPAAPVRRKPNHRKEMVNQLLFGEAVEIIKSKGDLWVKIRSLQDEYEGWMTNSLLLFVEESAALAVCEFVTADLLNEITIGDKKMYLPAGASLPFFESMPFAENGSKGKLGELEFTVAGNYYKRHELKPEAETIKKLILPWVNVPYLWGGRTPLGIDCSGFTQVIYKQMGIDLPRDAWQQAQEGKVVKKIADAQTGDLAFFNNKEDIVHVGILLGDERIIHSSGKVRIDKIDKKGIIDAETGERKLSLKAIRRVW